MLDKLDRLGIARAGATVQYSTVQYSTEYPPILHGMAFPELLPLVAAA